MLPGLPLLHRAAPTRCSTQPRRVVQRRLQIGLVGQFVRCAALWWRNSKVVGAMPIAGQGDDVIGLT